MARDMSSHLLDVLMEIFLTQRALNCPLPLPQYNFIAATDWEPNDTGSPPLQGSFVVSGHFMPRPRVYVCAIIGVKFVDAYRTADRKITFTQWDQAHEGTSLRHIWIWDEGQKLLELCENSKKLRESKTTRTVRYIIRMKAKHHTDVRLFGQLKGHM
jgi:hypothetical protein